MAPIQIWNLRESGKMVASRRPNQGKKRGQPFRITQSQLREVVIHIGLSALKIKPFFKTFNSHARI
jgi:hypothetical protein